MSALGPGSCSGCGMAYSLSALHAQVEVGFATERVRNLNGGGVVTDDYPSRLDGRGASEIQSIATLSG
jgi:hypothetical protein